MERTLTSVTILLIAFFITWLINRVFKLKLPTNLMGFIAVLLWGLLQFIWFLWPVLSR